MQKYSNMEKTKSIIIKLFILKKSEKESILQHV